MSKTLRFISALGAVLFALVGLSACGGGIPGNAVVQVGGNADHEDRVRTLDVGRGGLERDDAGTTAKPVVPEPPNYTACIAHLRSDRAETGQRPEQRRPTAQLKTQCEQQYKSLQQEVLGFLISSQWVLGEAHSPGREASATRKSRRNSKKSRRSSSRRRPNSKNSWRRSGQTVSDLLLRVKLNLLSQKIQKKIVKDKEHRHARPKIEKYYNENKSRFGTPEKRNVEIILTKTEAAGERAPRRKSNRARASRASPRATSIDPTSKANGGLLTGSGQGPGGEGARHRDLLRAKSNVLERSREDAVRLLHLRSARASRPARSRRWRRSKATIKQQLTATSQQAALSKFVKEFKKKWMAKTECRSGYVVVDCKQYKAPKTTATARPAPPSPPASTAQLGAGSDVARAGRRWRDGPR